MNLEYINLSTPFNKPNVIFLKNNSYFSKLNNKNMEILKLKKDKINRFFFIKNYIFFIVNNKKLFKGSIENNKITNVKFWFNLYKNYFLSNSSIHFILKNKNNLYGFGSNLFNEISLNKEMKFFDNLIEIKWNKNSNSISKKSEIYNNFDIITKENFTFYLYHNKILINGNLKKINYLFNINYLSIQYEGKEIIDIDYVYKMIIFIDKEGKIYKWGYQNKLKDLKKKIQNDNAFDYSIKFIEITKYYDDFFLLDYKGDIYFLNLINFEKQENLKVKNIETKSKAIKILSNNKFFIFINEDLELEIMMKKFIFTKVSFKNNNLNQINIIDFKWFYLINKSKYNKIESKFKEKKLKIIENITSYFNDNQNLFKNQALKNKSVYISKSNKFIKKFLSIKKNLKKKNLEFHEKIYNTLYKESNIKINEKPINLFYKKKEEFKEFYLKLIKNDKFFDILKLSFTNNFKKDNIKNLNSEKIDKKINKKILFHEKYYNNINFKRKIKMDISANKFSKNLTNICNELSIVNKNNKIHKSLNNNNLKCLKKPINKYLKDNKINKDYNIKLKEILIKKKDLDKLKIEKLKQSTLEYKKNNYLILIKKRNKRILIKEFWKIICFIKFMKNISLLILSYNYNQLSNYKKLNKKVNFIQFKIKNKFLQKNLKSKKINFQLNMLKIVKLKINIFFRLSILNKKIRKIKIFIIKNIIYNTFNKICILNNLYKFIFNIYLENKYEIDYKVYDKIKIFDKYISEFLNFISKKNKFWNSFIIIFIKIKEFIRNVISNSSLKINLIHNENLRELNYNLKKIYFYYIDLVNILNDKSLLNIINNKIKYNTNNSAIKDINIEKKLKIKVIDEKYNELLINNKLNLKKYFFDLNVLSEKYVKEINNLRVNKMLTLSPDKVFEEYEKNKNIDNIPFYNLKLRFLVKLNPKELKNKPIFNFDSINNKRIIINILKQLK